MSKSYDIERTSQGFTIEEADESISDLLTTLRKVRSLCDGDSEIGKICSNILERFNNETARPSLARDRHENTQEISK